MELKREIGEISRSSEFFSVSELEAQTGQPRANFAGVALKELMDNAIDASEAASTKPEVSLDLALVDDIRITVTDNGIGISPSTIDRIKNFDIRVTDKLNYRSPSRGQQGNALKTVLGLPYALGGTQPVVISSRGIEHTIYASPDPLGQVKVMHAKKAVHEVTGTTVALTLPRDPATHQFSPLWWSRAYGLANPHVLIKIRYFDEKGHASYHDKSYQEISESYHPTVQIGKQWRKFIVNDLTAPAWYNADTLKRQIFTHIKNNSGLSLREFVKTFRGLSASAKAKAVCDRLPNIHHLGDFESQPEQIAFLLAEMKEVADPPSPKVLGFIGKEHFRLKFDEWFGIEPDRFFYRRSECIVGGIPFIIEAASAQVKTDRGDIFHLLNFSPAFEDPLTGTSLVTEKVSRSGLKSFMRACYANPYAADWENSRRNVAVALHIVSPAFEFLDRGKTRISLPPEVAHEIAEVLWVVGKSFYDEGKKREKDSHRQTREAEKGEKQKQKPDITLIEAVTAVLPAAIAKVADYPVSVRDLYYVVREKIQQHIEEELEYSYFSNLLATYEQDYGQIPNLYRDPRGFLYEPHTARRIQLGTREVESYRFPAWLYNKILFVEKKGFVEPFIVAGIPEKYDLAIVAAEGYASKAIRTLFRNADRDTDYKLFVLHDADHIGCNIARTMREATARMPEYHVDIIDLGFKLQEALDMGLSTEFYSRKNAIPSKLVPLLTELELEYFTGVQVGKKERKAKRIELNALGPEERIAFLERKLVEHGATAKVLPPDGILQNRMIRKADEKAREIARTRIEDYLDIESMIDECVKSADPIDVTDDIDEVKEKLTTNPVAPWHILLDLKAFEQAENVMGKLPLQKMITDLCLEKVTEGS